MRLRRDALPAVATAVLAAVLALSWGCGATSSDHRETSDAACADLRFERAQWVDLDDPSRTARRREVDDLLACVTTRRGRSIGAQRQAYVDAARWIADWGRARVAEGEGVESVARDAVDARNELKVTARRSQPPHLRRAAETRNRRKYGNPVGPTYEDLIRAGKTPAQVIAGAGRTNRELNELLGVR